MVKNIITKILQSRLLRWALLVVLIFGAINFTLASASATSAGRIDGIGLGVPGNSKTETLDQLKGMGINQVRVEIPWQQVEPREGEFFWSFGSKEKLTDFDALINDLDKRGMQVVVVLSGGPAYLAHKWPGKPVNATALIDRWKVYVQAVVKRYGNRVDIWQIGLEPNRPSMWGKVLFPTAAKASAKPNAKLYTLMLMESYRIIKSAGPNDMVLMGGLTNPMSTECMQPAGEFLQQVEAAGGWTYFDALAVDLFLGGNSPEVAWKVKYPKTLKCANNSKAQNLAGQIRAVQAEAAPFADKPLWVTAVGWRMDWLKADAKKQKIIPEQMQADYMVRALVPLLSTSGVDSVMSFSYKDSRLSGYELSQLSRRALSNLSKLLTGAFPEGQIRGQKYTGAKGSDDVFEYRFRVNGRTIIYLWRAQGGQTRRATFVKGLDGYKVSVYPTDAVDLRIPAYELTVHENGSVEVQLSERPLILVVEPSNIFVSLARKIGDGLHAITASAKEAATSWVQRQKNLAVASFKEWLRGLEEKILGSVQIKLDAMFR